MSFDAPNFRGLASGFLHHAAQNPKQVALVHDDRTWTYGEILEEAKHWATRLNEAAYPNRPQRIGVFTQQGSTEHIGKIAALLVGAAFVPLNPKFPSNRTAEMIRQAGVDAIIVDEYATSKLPEILKELTSQPAILLPEGNAKSLPEEISAKTFDSKNLMQAQPSQTIASVSPDDLAYILFTSGSTGNPKGVPITHSNVRAFIDINNALYDFSPADVFALTFDSTFDLSLFGPFMAWENGASAVTMLPSCSVTPIEFLNKHSVSVWFSVPSVAKNYIRDGVLLPDSLPALRYSLFCGEALQQTVAEAWQAAAPNSRLDNKYGPTEGTISIIDHIWDSQTSPAKCVNGIVPIGQIYNDHLAVIVDEELRDVPPNQKGELCIAGPQIFAGYWQSPELNAPRFFERKETDGSTLRFYRTGDLVVKGQDGAIAFLGRNDQQIKLNGYRIELGDIESKLREAGCTDAIAFAWPANDPKMIVAAVTGENLDVAEVKAHVKKQLPPYMVPHRMASIDAMPLNANGKIDRKEVYSRLEAIFGHSESVEGSFSLEETRKLVADALEVDVGKITDSSMFSSVEEWDSLGQVGIELAIEEKLGQVIGSGHDSQLRSVQGIFAFIEGRIVDQESKPNVPRSLRGISVADTTVTDVNTQEGKLSYRGYDVRELAKYATFEQVAYLLFHRDLPDHAQKQAFEVKLAAMRSVPDAVIDNMRLLVKVGSHPADALAASISFLSAIEATTQDDRRRQMPEKAHEAGLRLIAQIPTLIAAHYSLRQGKEPIPPNPEFGHAENFLHMLGVPRTEENTDVFNKDAVLHADNGASAATFAALVASGAWSSIHDAVTAAAHTFKGGRHGDAAESSYKQVISLSNPEAVRIWVNQQYDEGKTPNGMGHAVWHGAGDPRLEIYREVVSEVVARTGNTAGLAKIDAMIGASDERTGGRMAANYDLYQGLLYESLGLPVDISTSMYISYRVVGWIANVLDQSPDQPLMRPDFTFVGHPARPFPEEHISTKQRNASPHNT